jgi:hypothetical protein
LIQGSDEIDIAELLVRELVPTTTPPSLPEQREVACTYRACSLLPTTKVPERDKVARIAVFPHTTLSKIPACLYLCWFGFSVKKGF